MARRDVFVSYSQSDRDLATELVSWLEAHGVECWVAPRDIAPAADWAAEIIDAISAARVMVLVFSANANASPQVRREVERAVHKGVSVLPVRIEDVLPSKSLEYFLSTQHWLDAFPPPREPHYVRLRNCVGEILEADSIAVPHLVRDGASGPPDVERAPVVPLFDAPNLRSLEAELARYVGPLAKHLVKRALARVSSIDELVQNLGGEIESERDRRQFIAACTQFRQLAH